MADAWGNVIGASVGGPVESSPKELDAVGANAGTYPEVIWNPQPDENGAFLLPYPRMSDPSHPGVTYSIDGIPVPVDYFMSEVEAHFHSDLGLFEAAAGASRPRLLDSRVYDQEGQFRGMYGPAEANRAMGLAFEVNGTLVRDWLVSDNWASTLGILDWTEKPADPQNPDTFSEHALQKTERQKCDFAIPKLTADVAQMVAVMAHENTIFTGGAGKSQYEVSTQARTGALIDDEQLRNEAYGFASAMLNAYEISNKAGLAHTSSLADYIQNSGYYLNSQRLRNEAEANLNAMKNSAPGSEKCKELERIVSAAIDVRSFGAKFDFIEWRSARSNDKNGVARVWDFQGGVIRFADSVFASFHIKYP